MRTGLLLFACVSSFRQLRVNQTLKAEEPRFETLEECEKAYAELLGLRADKEIVEPPVYKDDDTPKPAAPKPKPTLPPMKHGEVGAPAKVEAKPAYHPPATDGTPDDQKGWDYADHGDDWDAEACKAGKGQSPIDIVKYVDIGGQTKSVLWFDYYADQSLTSEVHQELRTDGHGMKVTSPAVDFGFVKEGANEYEVSGFAFHAPAEHTIDGQVFPLELQIMHKGPDDTPLGISILFKYGASNAFLAALKDAVPEMPRWTVEKGSARAEVAGTFTDFFNLEQVLPMGRVHPGKDMTFYNYQGSLTQPPCTSGVEWWVTAEPLEGTKDEIAHVRDAIFKMEPTKRGNNRNAQPLGERKVLVGHTGYQHHVKMHGNRDQDLHHRGYSSQDAPWQK